MTTHIRSTDKDLLVAQRVLSTLRYPSRLDLVKKAEDRDTVKAKERFVQASFGDGTLKTVQPKKTKMYANYDMRVSFQLNNIPLNTAKYKGIIHFSVKDCAGEGMTKAACLQDATDRFRQYLVTGLRTEGTNIRSNFYDSAIITTQDDQQVMSDIATKVAEKLRIWIGNQLWKVDTKIRKNFPNAVKHEEVRFTRICAQCGISKVTHNFNNKHLKATKQWVCLECMPEVKEDEMSEDEDEKGENKDNDENPEDELEDEDDEEDDEEVDDEEDDEEVDDEEDDE